METPLPHGIVDIHRMYQAPVVPQQKVPNPPFVVILIVRLGDLFINFVQHGITFAALPINNAICSICIKIQRFITSIFVCPDKRMNYIRRLVSLLLSAFLRAAWRALGIVAMNCLQPIDLRLLFVR